MKSWLVRLVLAWLVYHTTIWPEHIHLLLFLLTLCDSNDWFWVSLVQGVRYFWNFCSVPWIAETTSGGLKQPRTASNSLARPQTTLGGQAAHDQRGLLGSRGQVLLEFLLQPVNSPNGLWRPQTASNRLKRPRVFRPPSLLSPPGPYHHLLHPFLRSADYFGSRQKVTLQKCAFLEKKLEIVRSSPIWLTGAPKNTSKWSQCNGLSYDGSYLP